MPLRALDMVLVVHCTDIQITVLRSSLIAEIFSLMTAAMLRSEKKKKKMENVTKIGKFNKHKMLV